MLIQYFINNLTFYCLHFSLCVFMFCSSSDWNAKLLIAILRDCSFEEKEENIISCLNSKKRGEFSISDSFLTKASLCFVLFFWSLRTLQVSRQEFMFWVTKHSNPWIAWTSLGKFLSYLHWRSNIYENRNKITKKLKRYADVCVEFTD